MNTNSTTRFLSALLDLLDDFVAEFRSRMIATQLIRSVASTAAQYRAAQRTRSGTRIIAKLSRRLEPVRQALFVADEIIEKTFSPRRNLRRLPPYDTLPGTPTKSSPP